MLPGNLFFYTIPLTPEGRIKVKEVPFGLCVTAPVVWNMVRRGIIKYAGGA
jgi:hypothetical protein